MGEDILWTSERTRADDTSLMQRYTASVMDHEVAATTEPLGAVVVHSPSDASTPVFELGRLPFELRVKVVVAAICYPIYRGMFTSLPSVCKEFRTVVLPYIWKASSGALVLCQADDGQNCRPYTSMMKKPI